jgi:hypothetical protein
MRPDKRDKDESRGAAASGKNQPAKWLQFRLRTLLIVVTLLGGLFLAWRTYAEPYRRQRGTMALVKQLGGTYETAEADKWRRLILGGDLQNLTLVDLSSCREPQEYLAEIAALPALETLGVGSVWFDDACLARLRSLDTLRELLLDSTSVTEEALADLKAARPELVVCRSERLAIADLRKLGQVDVERVAPYPDFAFRLADKNGEVARSVFLRETTIDDAQAAPLGGLRHAETVMLSFTQIGDATLARLAGLKRLKLLYLDGTQVTDEGMAHLKGLEQLEVLYLDNTQVSDEGLRQMTALRQLKVLGLAGASVTPEGIDELRRDVPMFRVFR